MSKFTCKCGHVINLIASPNENEWRLIREGTLEDIVSALDEGKIINGEMFLDFLRGKEITVYRCPSCGRLHLEEAGRNKFVSYVKEVSA
ncbi:hypothetical protein [Paraburkholderia tropica]|uniref:hypothetical protein n=1 Tax=Paraburkholderia tropica TaxID=92647 RepID=UPI002AB634B4|nr:hypothetical protein [Paraburkholderia tropica]